MIKRPFFGFGSPKLKYAGIEELAQPEIQQIPVPEALTLFIPHARTDIKGLRLRPGTEVKTGQKLPVYTDKQGYMVSPATGILETVSINRTYADQAFLSVTIRTAGKDNYDPQFMDAARTSDPENALAYLASLPGVSDFSGFVRLENPLHTLIITGTDPDLLVLTNQRLISAGSEDIKGGLDHLKTISGPSRVVVMVPPALREAAEKTGAEVRVINPVYPNTLPRFLARHVTNEALPADRSLRDAGIGVISAEAVLALKTAFTDQIPPVEKVISVIHKDDRVSCVRARIGTPVREILSALDISVQQGDRIVFGGPMTGQGVYSEHIPVMYDTDAVFVQDKAQVVPNSDNPCINCGECVRACPAKLPVNMLVRLLENGLYEEAAQRYDLLSCVECGLCSYVCMLHIPVFHYIMLGKHELAQRQVTEDANG